MDNHGLPQVPLALDARLVALPLGAYGISYDMSTRKTEDNPPRGWHARRAPTYIQLVKHLQNCGFQQRQYSDWLCQDIQSIEPYWVMIRLKRILPPGKFESTVKKNIKMHLVTLEGFDATPDIQLGGLYSPELEGPTPAGLVPPTIPAVTPPPGGPLPKHTRDSEEARDHNNWRI
ncbi:hypothetical protein SCLCIDRAFT_26152 [Scleroderma citrinum Foug A]|uniref:Uncharacterized protein n=1 Tax=Scleroderma citrinum Foug A TaxID=1036808 RepID=A0A0C2ZH36_9AGAM|nr:hypothetical protein SCLCIDRAFT_26152 [Scleroderma citrinum Foug A]